MLKTIQSPPSNYLITYYQPLHEVIWLLMQEKLDKRQMFLKKTWKKLQIFIKNF